MANIPLRTYIREIEVMVEQGHYDQAIAHCKHILKTYPKYIDSYRLLGKAYLESQRYGDASDIFQRVLSSVPDDFVSHVGMNIIREDEGNLNEAVWHMERAFEIQPANNAVQSELKRLYGRRDGIEPSKVNLTRGALARMYVKGSLFQQAIAELHISLAEDPQRLDLQALLARAYSLSGQQVEAADICNTLLNKLPYCMDANMILAGILAESRRTEEAQVCRTRLYALNPYNAHISETNPIPERVPEGAVMIEKLEWNQGLELSSEQPEWVTSLGIEVNAEDSKENIPEWLLATPVDKIDELNTKEIPLPTELGVGHLEVPDQSGTIPEWIIEAGKEQPAKSGMEMTNQFETKEGESSVESLAHAEIPGWMQSLAPEEIKPGEPLPSTGSVETTPEGIPMLGETAPGSTDSISTWLKELEKEDMTKADALSDQNAEEVPDWLEEMSKKSGIEGDFNEASKPIKSSEQPALSDQKEPRQEQAPLQGGIPEWLAGFETEHLPTEEAIGWLNQGGELEEAQSIEPISKQQPESTSEWLPDTPEVHEPDHTIETDLVPETQDESLIAETPVMEEDTKPVRVTPQEGEQTDKSGFEPLSDQDTDAAFAWLEGLAAKNGAKEAFLLKPEERLEEPPDWVKETSTSVKINQEGGGVETQLPDWLESEKETPAEEQPPRTQEPSESELPEWLLEETGFNKLSKPIEPFTGIIPEEQLTDRNAVENNAEPDELPEWLSDVTKEKIVPIEHEVVSSVELTSETPIPERIETTSPDTIIEPKDTPILEEHVVLPPSPASVVEAGDEEKVEAVQPENEFEKMLFKARDAISSGKNDEALNYYTNLVKNKQYLPEVTKDLEEELYRHPLDVSLWTCLGDAYMSADQLQYALDAYAKAEELLHLDT